MRAGHHHAVVAEKGDVLAAHGVGDALAFAVVERQAVVVGVDGDAADVAHGVLAQRGVERAVGGERERRGIRHVGVQHHGMAGDAVHRGVDEQRGGLDAVPAFEHPALAVDEHDVVGADLAPVQAARVDEVAVGRAGHGHAEVVAHAFGQAMVGGGAQGQRQVFAQPESADIVESPWFLG
jgi:hypothetical protein